MVRTGLATFSLLALVSCADSDSSAADSGLGIDANAEADASVDGPPGTVLWSYNHQFITRKAPAFVDGVLYFQGQRASQTPAENDTMLAIADRDSTGERLWGHKTDSATVPAPSVSVEGSTVYVPVVVSNGQGQEFTSEIIRYDLNGTETGRLELFGPLRHGISFAGDGTYYSPVIDVHAHQGDTASWTTPFVMDDIGDGNPARTGTNTAVGSTGRIFVGSRATDKNLYAIDEDGELGWRQKWGPGGIDNSPTGFIGPIAVQGTMVYAANTSDVLRAIHQDTGETQWLFQADLAPKGLAVSSDGTVYFGTGGLGTASVKAVRDGGAGEGELLWTTPMPSVVDGTPAISAGGTVYVAACNTFFALSASDGSEAWSFDAADEGTCLDWSAATIAPNGRVYTSVYNPNTPDTAGVLYAFAGDGTGPAQDAWSSDGGNNRNTGAVESSSSPE